MNKNNTIAVIQARMESTRLPGKVLMPLAGKSVLFHIVERLKRVRDIDKIIIATTSSKADLQLVEYCISTLEEEVYVYKGSVNDLIGRYIACGQEYSADIMVMVDGDCPLIHPPTIERMIGALKQDPSKEYCRIDDRGIEGGVAVLRLDTFRKMDSYAESDFYREHATMFLVENPQKFSIVEIKSEDDFAGIKHRLWLDTEADYKFLTRVYNQFYKAGHIVNLKSVVQELRSNSNLRGINAHVNQKNIRQSGRPMVFIPEEGSLGHINYWVRFLRILTEKYHVGLRILLDSSDVNRNKLSSFPISEELPKESDVVVFVSKGIDGFVVSNSSSQGSPRIQLGDSNRFDLEDVISWVTAYAGYRTSGTGYSEVEILDSSDGRHIIEKNCPICKSSNSRLLWEYRSGIASSLCENCGHVYTSRILPQSTINLSYRDYQLSYPQEFLLSEDNVMNQIATRRKSVINSVAGNKIKSVLEIGSGYGHFLKSWESEVFKVAIEPSVDQAAFSRSKFGLNNTWECYFNEIKQPPPNWPKDKFDIVCMFHVLEHLQYPREVFNFIRSNLKDDGLLCIAVPNLHTLSPDLIDYIYLVKNWHLNFFHQESLKLLLRSEGFEIQYIKDEDPSTMEMSSIFIVAKRIMEIDNKDYSTPDLDLIQESADKYFKNMNQLVEKIKEFCTSSYENGKTIFLYGGGIHTKSLLELTKLSKDIFEGIIDDDPRKVGTDIKGIPIFSSNQAMKSNPDVILVSSFGSEAKILDRLMNETKETEIVGIYKHLSQAH